MESGLKPELQEFEVEVQGEALAGTNVLVRMSGSAERPPLVIGAHIDAAPLRQGGLSRGAIDNAAGSAVVLHLARRLAESNLEHPLVFVLFDLEERRFLGSRHFLEQAQPGAFAAMVNVDIVTNGELVAFGPKAGAAEPRMYALAQRVCASTETHCMDFPNYPPSDDRTFQAAGIANISFAALPEVQAHQLWLRLNGGQGSGLEEGFLPDVAKRIHTAGDVIDQVSEEALETLTSYLEGLRRRARPRRGELVRRTP